MIQCNLCRINEATKKNSHIFPRFLGTSMLSTPSGNKVYLVKDFNKYIPSQDTPKEDFILCPECERLLSDKYETYIANKFYYQIEKKESYFIVSIRNQYFYRNYFSIDYVTFKKFIYSMLFRAGITRLPQFDMNINYNYLNNLRKNLLNPDIFDDYPLLVIRSLKNSNISNNQIFGVWIDEGVWYLAANEFHILIDLTKKRNFFNRFEGAVCEDNFVRILTLPFEFWTILLSHWTYISQIYMKKRKITEIMEGLIKYKNTGA